MGTKHIATPGQSPEYIYIYMYNVYVRILKHIHIQYIHIYYNIRIYIVYVYIYIYHFMNMCACTQTWSSIAIEWRGTFWYTIKLRAILFSDQSMWRHDFQLLDAITLEPVPTTAKSAYLMGPDVVRMWQPLCSLLKFENLGVWKLLHPAQFSGRTGPQSDAKELSWKHQPGWSEGLQVGKGWTSQPEGV